ncbi:MAG TPA: oligosaccharyl transferase, archaeosortase A system-associated [Methanotrichaceae archaeon]|nr:oligosaccharyl transferase, archaeosortase A system-associated [Methanotrichaceae archaeon]
MDHEKRNEYAGVLVAFILGLMLRFYSGRNALVNGNMLFDGYDTFYHMRRIMYTVSHFPNTLWFDSYMDYPHGMELTWPPLFDQLIAGASLALGIHSQNGTEMVAAVMPVIFGSITILVVYYLTRELFDGKVALLSAFMTALAPYYLLKSMFSATDHHVLEGLFFSGMVLFLVLAYSRHEKRYVYAAASGLVMAALAYTWAGAAIYLGVIFFYVLVQMILDLHDGISSRDTVLPALTAFGVALALMAPFGTTVWLSPSLLITAGIIIATLLLFGLSQILLARKVHWAVFPIAIAVLSYGLILMLHFLGQFWIFSEADALVSTGGEYLLGGGMIGKIAEAEPIYVRVSLVSNLGLNILYYMVGLIALGAFIRRTERKQGALLLLIWSFFILVLTVGQVRFLYLFSISAGILISVLFFEGMQFLRSRMAQRGSDLPKAAAFLILAILILPSVGDVVAISGSTPVIADDWFESLKWLEENTPATSYYDDPIHNPEYSIFSWWDYGNWIVYESKRPVVANNFQAGVIDSARFYLSQNENESTAILDRHSSKYVFTDFDLVYGKLAAITAWIDEDPSTYQQMVDYGSYVSAVPSQKLMGTTLAKLYMYDGSGMGHFRTIYESRTRRGTNPPTSTIKISEYVPGAVITGTTQPDQPVGVLLNLTSNQGRKFQYFNIGIPQGDRYEVRVPYSTEKKYDTHATDGLMIFSGGKSAKVNVSEDDVQKGRSIEVDF